MKPALIDVILNEVVQPYPSIAAATLADSTPYEFHGVYWTGYLSTEVVVDWEQNRYFLLLVLAAEEVEVEWVAAE